MKPQNPNVKLQGNSKPQASNGRRPSRGVKSDCSYPALENGGWVLSEETTPKGAARHPFDLEERTAKFGEAIIRFCKKIPRGPGNDRIIDQRSEERRVGKERRVRR